MANRTIPLGDKELVLQRLAEGMSTRQAIRSTTIRSNQTAARLAKLESHKIRQIREHYLEKIESEGVDLEYRAKMWAKMAKATRNTGSKSGKVEVPDWAARKEALKYIDELAGIKEKNDPLVSLSIASSTLFDDPKINSWAT